MGCFCSRKSLLKLILGALSVLLLYKLLFVIYCDEDWSKDVIYKLCDHYNDGLIDGDVCHALCVDEEFQYRDCFNYRHRKLALKMKWKGRVVMLKALEPYLENFNNDLKKLRISLDKDYAFDEKLTTISTLLRIRLNNQITKYVQPKNKLTFDEIYQRLWTGNTSKSKKAEIVSVGSLSSQREYIFFQFYRNMVNFPDVFGTCGHMYVVEYTPPPWTLNPGASGLQEVSALKYWTWDRRAQLASNFMQMLRNFEVDFHEPFYFCDIKHPNFGITDDLTVKAIDVDMAYYKSTVESFIRKRKCTKETEATSCRFFDCITECDEHTGKCRLQENIFRGQPSSWFTTVSSKRNYGQTVGAT
ncbi:divergent protein kinase domain 1C-like isoform X2 [Anneissia japonica]|uniref:divergent protein kinase domain 1C-like isoform X2 n=1 Tax=Anneissia japonica TaxID=1529436 RepID=UPI0014256DFD|nr:divergent protein kinase domain 1C-like isoform X2 [Anneissia japonica]